MRMARACSSTSSQVRICRHLRFHLEVSRPRARASRRATPRARRRPGPGARPDTRPPDFVTSTPRPSSAPVVGRLAATVKLPWQVMEPLLLARLNRRCLEFLIDPSRFWVLSGHRQYLSRQPRAHPVAGRHRHGVSQALGAGIHEEPIGFQEQTRARTSVSVAPSARPNSRS